MTYDTNGIQRRFFSRNPHLSARISILLVLLFFMAFPALSLEAASFIYDQTSGGNLTGFDMDHYDTINLPSSYTMGWPFNTEYYVHPGYIGRLVYTGEPTTFTFYKVGDKTGQGNNAYKTRFYFTHLDSCSYWREYFLVIRAKGLRHDGEHIDIYGKGSVIVDDTNTFELTEGAGVELVGAGETGYNSSGKSAKYNGTNEYKYRYKYSYIWLDVTKIHRAVSVTYKHNGYFESHFGVSTSNGLSLTFDLLGYYGNTDGIPEPLMCIFDVEKYHTSPISYNLIRSYKSPNNALPIASIRYQSKNREALITIASNSMGTEAIFKFRSTSGETSRFNLAFKSTLPQAAPVPITSSNHSFLSSLEQKPSPIDESIISQVLEGEIQLYVDANTPIPATGVYSSTIYVLVAPTDTI